MDQPRFRWIGEVLSERAQRFAGDKFRFLEQYRTLLSSEPGAVNCRMNLCAPQNFIRHPITDSGKTILHQQDRFNRRLSVSSQKFIDEFLIETALTYFWNIRRPPVWLALSMMKSNATKLPRIAKNEGLACLFENEMIMFLCAKTGFLDAHFSGHAKMQPEQIIARKFEEHSLSARFRTQQNAIRQMPNECFRVGSAKDPFPRMELYRANVATNTGIPFPPEIFHFGQLGHRAL